MQEIKSLSQFNKLKANPLLIVDFYATWCGPCKVISPVFDKLAKPHESSTSITFAQVDVDKAKDVAQTCGITAMPTFQFFKQGKKVDEVKGADVQQLTTKIGYYTAAAAKETGGQGQSTKVGESSTGPSTGSGSLRPLIDVNAAKLLNASLLSSVRNIASPPPAGYAAASASGSRLLIHLPFTQAVSPSHLKITIVKDSISNAPSRIQVGTNVPVRVTKSPEGVESSDLDMESIAKAENTQSFNIYSDEYVNGVAELKLKASKFTGVKSLTIRVDANMSGEPATVTKIGAMDIVGTKV
jgi:thioredoxin